MRKTEVSSVFLSICFLSICISDYQSFYLSVYVFPDICISDFLSIDLSVIEESTVQSSENTNVDTGNNIFNRNVVERPNWNSSRRSPPEIISSSKDRIETCYDLDVVSKNSYRKCTEGKREEDSKRPVLVKNKAFDLFCSSS